MCWPRVGEANPLFYVYSTLCRWTATSNFINAVKRQRNLGLGNTHHIFIDWHRDDWPFIYFVIFVSMDEKIECHSLYFLVSILRGIIFIVIVVITHTHIILASRWLTIYLLCYFHTFVWRKWVVVCSRSQYGFFEE